MRAPARLRTHIAHTFLLATLPLLLPGQSLAQALSQNTTERHLPASPDSASSSQAAPDDDDLAAPALTIDQSASSPLIQALYRATRETKQGPTLARIAEAQALLDTGTDIKSVDANGRNALHWTVFGSSYTTWPAVLVAYEKIADTLIQRGIDINHEDAYQDTPLDYLLYSPNFEIQTLLLEHGATSGFLAASFRYLRESSEDVPRSAADVSKAAMRADLTPGQTLSVRLNDSIYSDSSRTGDPIVATVTYPLCKSGEDLACPPGQLLIPPGTKVNGTVLFAQKAPDKYSRPRLILDFSNIVHTDGMLSPLYARVLNIDNARETVRNNEILGIVQPHANSKASLALSAVGVINPIAGYAVRGVQAVYGLSIRREVLLPPAPTSRSRSFAPPCSNRRQNSWPGWPLLVIDQPLSKLVTAAPARTQTSGKVPSDLTNLLFIGTQQQLMAAFAEAGWFEADHRSLVANLNAVQATLRQTDYDHAPVSTLLLEGRIPDLVFQKSLDTFAQRHHVRIWKLPSAYKGREVWVGAATHDIAVSSARAKTKWSHRIDSHIDRERDWIQSDLLFAGTASAYNVVDRPAAPRKASNATGDEVVTDGKMAVVELGGLTSAPSGVLSVRTQ